MTGQLLDRVLGFTHVLRDAGVPLPLSSVIDFCRSVEVVGLERREDLYAAGRATLIRSVNHLQIYDRVFTQFWRANSRPRQSGAGRDRGPEVQQPGAQAVPGVSGGDTAMVLSASAPAVASIAVAGREQLGQGLGLAHRNFASMTVPELEQARRQLAAFAALLALRPGRRFRRTRHRGNPDMRAMLRQYVLMGRDGIRPAYRARRLQRARVFVLCDVSGSMERHAMFLIQFMFALRARLPALELAVFSTGMTAITGMLEGCEPDRAVQRLLATVPSWSGGTDMGTSLGQFNDRYEDAMSVARSIVIVLGDGWDCGDAGRLDVELQRLRHRAHRLLWLNPRLADGRYRPLCGGMAIASRYIDCLLPAHDIAALAELVPHLRAAWH